MNRKVHLEYGKIIQTIERLEKRVTERFPASGLSQVIGDFLFISRKTEKNIEWLSRPMIFLRIVSYLIITSAIGAIFYSFARIDFSNDLKTISTLITTSEALFNELVLIGAAIFFMVTIENRVKRNKTSKFLNQLRVIAHVVDMHQLTKDPGMHDNMGKNTENSPHRELNAFELHRYLDYCSEAFSLIGKVAALYAQSLPNDVVVRTVNEIEELSTGLSQKVWQKLIILNEILATEEKLNLKNQRKKASSSKKNKTLKS